MLEKSAHKDKRSIKDDFKISSEIWWVILLINVIHVKINNKFIIICLFGKQKHYLRAMTDNG